jgi:hypothetical protein
MLRLLLRAAPAEDPAALRAELRRAQGSHVPAVLCRAAGAVPLQPPGAVQECWILCAVGGEVYGHTEQGAEHSAEHGAVVMVMLRGSSCRYSCVAAAEGAQ